MSRRPENPFERFDLDPKEGSHGITARLRELAEEAGEDERAAIRQAWEDLTMHPLRRLRTALSAFPPHPDAWQTEATYAPAGVRRSAKKEPATFAELAPRPSVSLALASVLVVSPNDSSRSKETLDDDPVLAIRPRSAETAPFNPQAEKKR